MSFRNKKPAQQVASASQSNCTVPVEKSQYGLEGAMLSEQIISQNFPHEPDCQPLLSVKFGDWRDFQLRFLSYQRQGGKHSLAFYLEKVQGIFQYYCALTEISEEHASMMSSKELMEKISSVVFDPDSFETLLTNANLKMAPYENPDTVETFIFHFLSFMRLHPTIQSQNLVEVFFSFVSHSLICDLARVPFPSSIDQAISQLRLASRRFAQCVWVYQRELDVKIQAQVAKEVSAALVAKLATSKYDEQMLLFNRLADALTVGASPSQHRARDANRTALSISHYLVDFSRLLDVGLQNNASQTQQRSRNAYKIRLMKKACITAWTDDYWGSGDSQTAGIDVYFMKRSRQHILVYVVLLRHITMVMRRDFCIF